MNEKKSLLERYSIPIEHLDFDYIRECKNIRELEKMIEILKSGEEGYYPDLIKFTETKLNELDPNNRMLRIELQCHRTSMNEQQQINEFVENIRSKDRKIRAAPNNEDNNLDNLLPPIRASVQTTDAEVSVKSTSKRITSTDYNQWDKFDADTECLKIDLTDEKIQEKMAIDQKRHQHTSKLIEILPNKMMLEKIDDIEKQKYADNHRIKGNEFFKCSDYQQAIMEYTASLTYTPTAAVFNNRALAYLKQKKYIECIEDCDESLKLKPTNVKAMLRKCEALIATDRKNEAYKQYTHVLSIDSENTIAKKALQNISLRLEIHDVNVQTQIVKISEVKKPEAKILEINSQDSDDEIDDNDKDDYKKLIIPTKIVPSKFARAMSTIKRFTNQ